jgi:serine/threonine protein kinase
MTKMDHTLKDIEVPRDKWAHVMYQCCSALKYMHGMKVIHRDLKLRNILVNEHFDV